MGCHRHRKLGSTRVTSSETINHIITTRRTIQTKDDGQRDIPLDILQQILENANCTHARDDRALAFHVFMGAAREKLAGFLAETYKAITPVEIFKPNKYEGMRENAMLAPAVIAIGMKRQPSKKLSWTRFKPSLVLYRICTSPQPLMV